MSGAMLGLLAETPIHSGSGQAMGAIDLPVSRERVTDFPFIAGSGLKGALREATPHGTDDENNKRNELFGIQERAGAILVSDARILLLPVRSLDGPYRWATCPYIIERLSRDLLRVGIEPEFTIPKVADGTAIFDAGGDATDIMLEERLFTISDTSLEPVLLETFAKLIGNSDVRARLGDQLMIVSDGDFAWFARFGLPIQARNHLAEDTKTSQNLWYEETLPSDTLLGAVLMERPGASGLDLALQQIGAANYLQVGGNETVGQGWLATAICKNAGNGDG